MPPRDDLGLQRKPGRSSAGSPDPSRSPGAAPISRSFTSGQQVKTDLRNFLRNVSMLLGAPDCQLAADLPDAPTFSRGAPRLSVGREPPPNGRSARFPPLFLSPSLFLRSAFS